MANFTTTPSDSLLGRFNEQRRTLIDALGPLAKLFEGGGVGLAGGKAKIDLQKRNLSYYKKFGEKSYLDFDIKPETKEWNLGVSFDID